MVKNKVSLKIVLIRQDKAQCSCYIRLDFRLTFKSVLCMIIIKHKSTNPLKFNIEFTVDAVICMRLLHYWYISYMDTS